MRFSIDAATCISCDACVRECPNGAVRRDPDGIYRIRDSRCIRCSHCAAVCPVDAVHSDQGSFRGWKAPGLPPETVGEFLRGKRSVRRHRKEDIPDAVLDELLATGSLAATASNTQDCHAAILRGPALERCRDGVMAVYAALHRLVTNRLIRVLLRLTEARRYVTNPGRMEQFDEMIRDHRAGKDRLFFGAPVVVVLSAPRRNKRFGKSDCVLAGAHMMLHAESFGIGSCMIGFAEVVLNQRARLRRELGIPRGNRVNLVFTLGYSDVRYVRLPIRRSLTDAPAPP